MKLEIEAQLLLLASDIVAEKGDFLVIYQNTVIGMKKAGEVYGEKHAAQEDKKEDPQFAKRALEWISIAGPEGISARQLARKLNIAQELPDDREMRRQLHVLLARWKTNGTIAVTPATRDNRYPNYHLTEKGAGA